MIYFLRTLWVVFSIPVYLITCLAFFIGLISYPLIGIIYYIIHGEIDTMKWKIDTMAVFIERKYNNTKDKIETLKDDD